MRFFEPQTKDPLIADIIVNTIESIGISPMGAEVPDPYADEIADYDVHNFIDDVYDFLTKYQQLTGEFKDFSMSPSFTYLVPGDDEGNALRYNILQRTIASSEQGQKAHQGRIDKRWRFIKMLDDVQNPGYKALVYAKPFDNTVQFTSWSKNYRDADTFAFKLEELLDTYSTIFKAKGLLQLNYEGRGEDLAKEKSSFTWFGCPLFYHIRTLKTKVVYEKVLEQIAIDIITTK